MAKTVKFNLILDGYPVRNLEGLREHFSIEDVLTYYSNGLLVKWLDVRGYTEEFEKITAFRDSGEQGERSSYDIVSALIKIFGIETDDARIKEDLAVFNYMDERRMCLDAYKENAFQADRIIADYHAGYDALVRHMIENRESMALLKADVLELENSYMGLFKLDYYILYMKFVKEAPRAVYAMLTRPALREFYLGENVPPQIIRSLNADIIPRNKIYENIQEDVTVVQRDTQGMWDPIERGDVEVMVLYVADSGAFVKSYQGPLDEKLGAFEVNGKFLQLKGLEYQCNSSSNELVYMEV